MFENFIMGLVILMFSTTTGMCLSAKTDTIKEAARRDAGHFRLSDSLWKESRRNNFLATSDYFKPAKSDVKNIALLNDSVYVQSFR